MVDIAAVRAAAQAKKEEAKAKILAAKMAAEDAKAVRANPPKQYVTMPAITGDAEVDSAADLGEVERGFRARMKDDSSRKALATDTEYWACLCFQSRAQKDAFLQTLGLLVLGDKYIDGQRAAKMLGIELPSADVPYNTSAKIDPVWSGFVD